MIKVSGNSLLLAVYQLAAVDFLFLRKIFKQEKVS